MLLVFHRRFTESEQPDKSLEDSAVSSNPPEGLPAQASANPHEATNRIEGSQNSSS
jgi:hypothetical protein